VNRPFLFSVGFFIASFAANLCGREVLAALLLVAATAELWEALHRERNRRRQA
jgi:hypothetical protein